MSTPFNYFVVSPLNLVPKPNGTFRLIHNLAYPYDGMQAVNDCIPESEAQVQYRSIDDVLLMILAAGPAPFGAR